MFNPFSKDRSPHIRINVGGVTVYNKQFNASSSNSMLRQRQPLPKKRDTSQKKTSSLSLNRIRNASPQNAQDYDVCLQKLRKRNLFTSIKKAKSPETSQERIDTQNIENAEDELFPTSKTMCTLSKEDYLDQKEYLLTRRQERFLEEQQRRKAQLDRMEADLNKRIEQCHQQEVKLAIRVNKIVQRQRDAATFEEVLKNKETFLLIGERKNQQDKKKIQKIVAQLQQKQRIIENNTAKLMTEKREVDLRRNFYQAETERLEREEYSRRCLFEEELFNFLAYERGIVPEHPNFDLNKRLVLQKAQQLAKKHSISYLLLENQPTCSVCYEKAKRIHQKLEDLDIVNVRTVKSKNRPTDETGCSICLQEFIKGEVLTALHCRHSFHSDCISNWLHKSPDCPLCKQSQIKGR